MIALANEQLIPLREAPRHLPHRPNGKRLHISACYRWIRKGVRGVLLESIRIGGTTYTSLEALQRFAQRLSLPPDRAAAMAAPPPRTSSRRAARLLEVHLGLKPGSLPG